MASTPTVHTVLQTKKTNQRNWGTKKQQATKQHTVREGAPNGRQKIQWSTNDSTKKHHCRQCDIWHVSGKCPGWSHTCQWRKGRNHYAKRCLSRPSRVDAATEDQENLESFYLDLVTVDSMKTQRGVWICPLLINGYVVPVKTDTEAHMNILSEADYHQLHERPMLHPTKEILKGSYQGHIPVKGRCIVTVKHCWDSYRTAFSLYPVKHSQYLAGRSVNDSS